MLFAVLLLYCVLTAVPPNPLILPPVPDIGVVLDCLLGVENHRIAVRSASELAREGEELTFWELQVRGRGREREREREREMVEDMESSGWV